MTASDYLPGMTGMTGYDTKSSKKTSPTRIRGLLKKCRHSPSCCHARTIVTTKARITERYDAGNLMAACLIAADPVAYSEGGLMAEWSDIVLSRAATPDDADAGPLFAQRKAA